MTTTPVTAAERLRAAFEEAPPDTRRLRSLASTYTPDERYEHLLRLRHDDPALFATLATPMTRMALGSYEAAKAAFEEINP